MLFTIFFPARRISTLLIKRRRAGTYRGDNRR
jgi:hypothetical protein